MICDQKYIQFANELAELSGSVIRRYYRKPVPVESKNDMSPVTAADKQTEMVLRNRIEREFPDHGIQGEEFGLLRGDADYKWVIDPIDGTTSFLIGRPLFGTLIALTYQDKPILGVIDQPINHERWVGALGYKTIMNDTNIGVAKVKPLSNAILCTTADYYFQPEELKAFQAVSSKVQYTIYGGDCYNYGLLAQGSVDLIIEAGLKPHDFLALSIIVESAGGIFTDWEGNAITRDSDGKVIAASCKSLHEKALKMLADGC